MPKYLALLRGINVGGHKKVPMAELKQLLEKNGYQEVKTILASGNISFRCPELNNTSSPQSPNTNSLKTQSADMKPMITKFEKILENHFGFQVPTIIIPFEQIQEIAKTKVFNKIEVTRKIRLYITFSKEKITSTLKIPYTSKDNSFQILKIQGNTIFSVLNLEKSKTPDAMKVLEQEFSKQVTTRNFNTIQKISEKL